MTPYPLGHGHVTTIIQNSSTMPELPPAYHTLYGQHQHHPECQQQQQRPTFEQQRLPPIPSGLQGQ